MTKREGPERLPEHHYKPAHAARQPAYRRRVSPVEHPHGGGIDEHLIDLDPAGIFYLQRTIGNAAVTSLVQRDPVKGGPKKIRTEAEIEAAAKPLVGSMGDALDHWKNQSDWGIQNFVNEELEKRIDKLRSSGLTTGRFLQSLAGNLTWAAACFFPEAPIFAFIVGLTGIGVTAQASPPTATDPADKGAVSKMAEEMQGYLDKVEEAIRGKNDSSLLDRAKDLVLFHDELTQPELLELFITSTFMKEMLIPGVGGKLIRFNDEAVKKAQKEALKTRLQHFMEAVPLVGDETEPETVALQKLGGEYTLRLVEIYEVDKPGRSRHVRWGIGYETRPRETDLQGVTLKPGAVVVAKWISEDVVNDVLQRESDLKMSGQLIIGALPSEVVMGPGEFAAHEEELRQRMRYGRAG